MNQCTYNKLWKQKVELGKETFHQKKKKKKIRV